MTDGAEQRNDGTGDRLRVLVVDDNALLGTSLARLLVQSGYDARATTTAGEALDAPARADSTSVSSTSGSARTMA
jgi:PleD family two-component response regulator